MDPLVYEDSPLANYFEGDAVPYDLPHEITPPHTPFAPRGLPHFRSRLKKIRQDTAVTKPTSTEQLVERFRYIIVASQLLSDDSEPRPYISDNDLSQFDLTSLTGAAITAGLSFLTAWSMSWLRNGKKALKIVSWLDVGIYCVGFFLIGTTIMLVTERQCIRHIQKTSIKTLAKFVDGSHSFDSSASSTIRFIQEVEVVSRGYNLTTPLPPVSRLDERQAIRRCRTLRTELASTLKLLIILFVESHNAIQPYVNETDLQRYHDIYEISLVEYSQAIELANGNNDDDLQDSLRELRFTFRLLGLARKVFLCDLLALQQCKGLMEFRQWNGVLRIIREVEGEMLSRQRNLAETLSIEEGTRQQRSTRNSSSESSLAEGSISTPESQTFKVQSRRFNEVANAIRSLNARVHILKEGLHGLTTANADECVISASMQKYYESLGTDIRNLVTEWERGRNTMLLNVDTHQANTTQYSSSSPSIRSPISPSLSIGNGLTIVDGGAAEALRLLNGDFDPYTSLTPIRKSLGVELPDEEIFEAISKPYSRSAKRMSVGGMSREEKMAKLQEDRRKRATLQEQADNTTSMLRELRMVMKHRHRQNTVSSGVASTTPSLDLGQQRVTSL